MTADRTVRLDESAANAFGELATRYGEPVDVLVNEALAGWLDVQAGHLAAIRTGLAQLDRGETFTQEEMEIFAASYDRGP